ncbi:MAG: hypothetical protein IKV32_00565 [Muribaculaceae bacterium]|nr:hypothetical protein [Muribaculaceae bacterium]
MKVDLKYRNEQDKCYGLTGVAMSAVILDIENIIYSISLDSDAFNSVRYTPQSFVEGNALISPRNVLEHNVKKFRLTMGMILANILCRTYVLDGKFINHKTKQQFFDYFIEEGKESCDLDKDEVSALFNKNYDYFQRIFSHPQVQSIANDFAQNLTENRTLTQSQIITALQSLNSI